MRVRNLYSQEEILLILKLILERRIQLQNDREALKKLGILVIERSKKSSVSWKNLEN